MREDKLSCIFLQFFLDSKDEGVICKTKTSACSKPPMLPKDYSKMFFIKTAKDKTSSHLIRAYQLLLLNT